ncbi:hypothetical protein CAEBREN_16172 [Caenorhabditis brenneri]|uniref:T-box domain-containing protein n=1 Tax=Caenorhabditis brenneri TaxID=135651 RepID=G0MB02_CAEBE|nr:hypothetical protein CAEBREN_16172 [Caenorhabditis brenneri]
MTPITVVLKPESNNIWQKCFARGHEMIINEKIQRIFPPMEFMISGMDQYKFYALSVHMERFDDTTGENNPSTSTAVYDNPKRVYHPRNPQSGSEWMSGSVSFGDVRITSTKSVELLSENFIHLRPGHRYQPILIVYEEEKPVFTSRIEHMAFTVTTKYHNENIRDYKSHIIGRSSSMSDPDEEQRRLSNIKRNSAMGPPAKQSNLDFKDEPSTSGAGLSVMPRSLSVSSGSGSHPGMKPVVQKPDATSGSKEPRLVKSAVTTSLPATPKPCMQFMKLEVESPRPSCPAPLITSKSIEVGASGSEEATPVEHMIQEAPAPDATESSARRSPNPSIENVSQDNVASPDVRRIRIDSIPGPSLPPMIQRDRPRDPLRDPPRLEEFIQANDIPGLGPHPRAAQYPPGLPRSFIAYCEDPFWTSQRTVRLPPGIMIPPRPFDYAERERLNKSPPPADPNWMPPPGTPPIAALADALAFRDRLQRGGDAEDSDADH